MKKRGKIFLTIIGVLIVFGIGMFLVVTDGLSEAVAVSIDGIDLSDVEDGKYEGKYDFKRWSTSADVYVKDNKIVSIDIAEDVKMAGVTDCATEIINRVIENQNTKVDAVSGATATSKAYLKAIENAFK